MREPGRADDVTDGENAGEVGLVIDVVRFGLAGVVVGLDVVLEYFEPERRVEEPVVAAFDADCEKNLFGLDGLLLGFVGLVGSRIDRRDRDLDARGGFFDVGDAGGRADVHAVLLEDFFHGDADVVVLDGQDGRGIISMTVTLVPKVW